MAAILSCSSGVWKFTLLLAWVWCQHCEGRDCSCGTTSYGGTSGMVTSPNYPNHYPNDCNCTYNITVNSAYRITIRFNEFSMWGACIEDYMRVYDAGGNGTGRPLCGTLETAMTWTSRSHTLLITFVSNHRGTSKGFNASYFITEYATQQMTTISTTTPTTPSVTHSSRHIDALLETSTSSIVLVTTKFKDAITYRTDATVQTNWITNDSSPHAHSGVESYIWMVFAVLGVALLLLLSGTILIGCIKRRRPRKMVTTNDNKITHLNALDINDPTVTVNQIYQPSDDFMASSIHSSGQSISDKPTVSCSKTDRNTAVYNFPDAPSKIDSPLYQIADDAGIALEYSPVEKNHKYAKVSAGSDGEHVYQTAEITTSYEYADISSPPSSSYQSPDMVGQYEYPSVIGRREGLSSVPNSPISDDQGKVYNIPTFYQELQPRESKGSSGRLPEAVDESKKNSKKPDKNQSESLTIKTPIGEEEYFEAVAHCNETVDVIPNKRKDSDNYEYDLVHTDGYQKITEQSQVEPSNNTIDMEKVKLKDQQKSNTRELRREPAMCESCGVLKSQEATSAIDESGYTAYNAEGFQGTYQELKPNENQLLGGH